MTTQLQDFDHDEESHGNKSSQGTAVKDSAAKLKGSEKK